MIRASVAACLSACAIVLAASTAFAHHSGAMFEEKKTITLEGVVKEFQYTNPHSWLLVNVTGKDGKVTTGDSRLRDRAPCSEQASVRAIYRPGQGSRSPAVR